MASFDYLSDYIIGARRVLRFTGKESPLFSAKDAFRVFQSKYKTLDVRLVLVFVIINFIVVVNAFIHNPEMGYDAEGHLNYITVLPTQLPTFGQSTEFFSPPLPYLLPSLVYQPCHQIYADENIIEYRNFDCRKLAGKFAQGINVLLSLGTTYLFLLIADKLRPGRRNFKFVALGLFGLLTVYYKTFAQVRGEPYVLFFYFLAIYVLMTVWHEPQKQNRKNAVWLGLILGLLILSRQWGFLIYPAILVFVGHVWLNNRPLGNRLGKFVALSFAVSLLVGGWFYFYLYANFGSVTTFNQVRAGFSLDNKPISFYRSTGLGGFLLFKDPIRPTFDNQFIPSFYSDIWGDYWGFFVFVRANSYLGLVGQGNQDQISPYLGRVNLVSIVPSLAFLGGILLGIQKLAKVTFKAKNVENSSFLYSLLFLITIFSMAGFMYFVITVPNAVQGDTVKATYVIHVLALLPLFGAEFLDKIETRFPRSYYLIVVTLVLIFLHNLPAMISRYF